MDCELHEVGGAAFGAILSGFKIAVGVLVRATSNISEQCNIIQHHNLKYSMSQRPDLFLDHADRCSGADIGHLF